MRNNSDTREAESKQTPVIAITGHALSEEQEHGLSAFAEAPAAVDLETLLDAASKDPIKLNRIVALYLHHTAERLEELKSAIKQESASEVCAIAHKCLGSSRTCGMIAIVPSLTELERLGKAGILLGAEYQLKNAQAAFEKIKRFLNEYFEPLAA